MTTKEKIILVILGAIIGWFSLSLVKMTRKMNQELQKTEERIKHLESEVELYDEVNK